MKCVLFCSRYMRHLLGQHLLVFNTLSSSLLMLTGGAITQTFELKYGLKETWEPQMLAHLTLVGGVIGAQQHYLYLYLDHKWPGHDLKPLLKKLLFDHTIITNITLATFFVGLNLLEGIQIGQLLNEFLQKYWMSYPVDVGIGLPTQLYNFYYLPPKFRVIFVAAVSTLTAVVIVFIKDVKSIERPREDKKHQE